MKQTAVEFLELMFLRILSFDSEEHRKKYKDVIRQAKEMEKKQQERSYSEEEVMDMFHNLSMHLPLHYEFLVKEQFKKK